MRQGKGVEQALHAFQNGYTRVAFPCGVLSKLECVRSAAFNKATMVSGDDLVRAIRSNSVRGIAVGIDVKVLDGLPREGIIAAVVAQCETT